MLKSFIFLIFCFFLLKSSFQITTGADACYFQIQTIDFDMASYYGICVGSNILNWDHTLANSQANSFYSVAMALQSLEYEQSLARLAFKPSVLSKTSSSLQISLFFSICDKFKKIKYRLLIIYLGINKILSQNQEHYFPTGLQTIASSASKSISLILSPLNMTGLTKCVNFLYELDIESSDGTFSKGIQISCSILTSTNVEILLFNRGSQPFDIFSIGFTLIRYNIDQVASQYSFLEFIPGEVSSTTTVIYTDSRITKKNSFYGIYKFQHQIQVNFQFQIIVTTYDLILTTTSTSMSMYGANYLIISGNNLCCNPTPYFQSIQNICYDFCPVQYYTSGSNCLKCSNTIINCLQCTDSTHCTKCPAGYFLSNPILCSLCASAVTECMECTSSTLCTKCNAGFYAAGNVCGSCNSTMANCQECSGNNVCTKCAANYHSSGSACFTCTVGFYFSGLSCLPCSDLDSNCIQCSDSAACTQCASGYLIQNSQCSSCSSSYDANCLECDQIKCLKQSILQQIQQQSNQNQNICTANKPACITIISTASVLILWILIELVIFYCKNKTNKNKLANRFINQTQQTIPTEERGQNMLKPSNQNRFLNHEQLFFQEVQNHQNNQNYKQLISFSSPARRKSSLISRKQRISLDLSLKITQTDNINNINQDNLQVKLKGHRSGQFQIIQFQNNNKNSSNKNSNNNKNNNNNKISQPTHSINFQFQNHKFIEPKNTNSIRLESIQLSNNNSIQPKPTNNQSRYIDMQNF